MAELSEQTKAIIDRLKAEGDLIRNSGTNSLRAVKMEFSKFDSVFGSINKNIAEQNQLMMRQLGMAEEAAEKARTQEQYEEVSKAAPPLANQTDSKDENVRDKDTSDSDKKIDAMGDAIASALSLKNIALAGAGAFVGYNLLKGFIDEKTGGGFSEMESNLGRFASELGSTSFAEMQGIITGMQTTFNDLKTTMDSLNDSLASLNEAIEYITSIEWQDIVEGVMLSIGLLTAYNLTMRAALALMAARGMGGMFGKGGRAGLFRKLLAGGLGVASLKQIFGANDPDVKAAVDAEADKPRTGTGLTSEQRAALSSMDGADYTRAVTGAGTLSNLPNPQATNPGMLDAGNAQFRQRNFTYDPLSGKYFSNRTGAELTGGAAMLAERTRLADLQAFDGQKPFIQGSYDPPKVQQAGRVAVEGQGERAAYLAQNPPADGSGKKIYQEKRGIIKAMAKTEAAKILFKAIPVAGAIAGIGFTIYSWAIGDYTTAALEGTSIVVPSVTGGVALDVGAAATSIFFHVTGMTFNPANPEHVWLMEQIAKDIKEAVDELIASQIRETRSQERTNRQRAMDARINAQRRREEEAANPTPPDPSTEPYYFEPYDSKRGTRYRLYNREGQLLRGNSTTRGGAQSNYSEFMLQQSSMNLGQAGALQTQLASAMASNQTPSVVVLGGGGTPVQQFISYANGGNQVQLTQASIGGGGGNGSGAGLTSYGLTQAFS